ELLRRVQWRMMSRPLWLLARVLVNATALPLGMRWRARLLRLAEVTALYSGVARASVPNGRQPAVRRGETTAP
ncbi:MAG: hypothetical protein M3337_03215, partial [Actinomycetota bacterium]|nr:hypothetical protein [Actinomycetota bacterium]